MNHTPSTRFVLSARTIWGSPTTRMLESSVAMKMPTVVTVRTTHLYSKRSPPLAVQFEPRFAKTSIKPKCAKKSTPYSCRTITRCKTQDRSVDRSFLHYSHACKRHHWPRGLGHSKRLSRTD